MHDNDNDPNCLFCKIAAKKIPSRVVYEDDEFFAFHDINPWAPIHFLVIPKRHIVSLAHLTDADAGLMGRLMALIPKLAQQEGCNPYPEGGFRVVTNTGKEGGQEIHHLHFHVMGGAGSWARG